MFLFSKNGSNNNRPVNNVLVGKKKDVSMKLKTVINGESLYQLYFNDCMYYISTNELYVGIIIDGKMHIFNTSQNSDEIPENLIQSLQFMNDANFNMSFLTTARIKLNKANGDRAKRKQYIEQLNEISNFKYYLALLCQDILDLESVQWEIERLNYVFMRSNPSLKLKMDYVFNFERGSEITSYSSGSGILLLCLMDNNNCISSLLIDINKNELVINSKTNSSYVGRKYNKLLRAVIIMIANKINPINPSSIPTCTYQFSGNTGHLHSF